MAFLEDEDYENLPNDDREAFVYLETIARKRLYASAENTRDNELGWAEVMGYMNEISAIAGQFDIPELAFDREPDNYRNEFATFTLSVEHVVAQIRVQKAKRRRANSVVISGPGREKIQHFLERIKAEVAASEIPERRRRRLLDKLTEFESELAKPRFDFAKAMAVVALIATTVGEVQGVLVESPKLMEAINKILGSEKDAEEEAIGRISASEPLKALKDLRPDAAVKPTPPALARGSFDDDLDDDVPF